MLLNVIERCLGGTFDTASRTRFLALLAIKSASIFARCLWDYLRVSGWQKSGFVAALRALLSPGLWDGTTS